MRSADSAASNGTAGLGNDCLKRSVLSRLIVFIAREADSFRSQNDSKADTEGARRT